MFIILFFYYFIIYFVYFFFFFFFNDTAPPEIYTLSLHDALPIQVHLAPVADRLHHLRERVERGDGPVQLPPPVVRHHHRVDAGVVGQQGVLRGHDPLQHDGQVAQGPQPGDVVPVHRRVLLGLHVREQAGLPLPDLREEPGTHVRQPDAGGHGEPVPRVPIPAAQHGRVPGDHERPVTRRHRALHQMLGELAIPVDVELEPPRRVRGRLGHLLDGRGGDRRQHHDRPGGRAG